MKQIILNICYIWLCISIMSILCTCYKTSLNGLLSWLASLVNGIIDKLQKLAKLKPTMTDKTKQCGLRRLADLYPETIYQRKVKMYFDAILMDKILKHKEKFGEYPTKLFINDCDFDEVINLDRNSIGRDIDMRPNLTGFDIEIVDDYAMNRKMVVINSIDKQASDMLQLIKDQIYKIREQNKEVGQIHLGRKQMGVILDSHFIYTPSVCSTLKGPMKLFGYDVVGVNAESTIQVLERRYI